MDNKCLRDILERNTSEDGVTETGLNGVQFYRVSSPIDRLPTVYTPRVCINVSGSKRVFQNGSTQVYDEKRFVCCTMPLPVEADVPKASKHKPLLGVSLEFDEQMMTETIIEMSSVDGGFRNSHPTNGEFGLVVGELSENLIESMLRLLQLVEDPVALKALSKGRLKEVYFTLLKSEAGPAIRHRFGERNEIASTIGFLKDNLRESFTIDKLAQQAGMSRAVFHRKFKAMTSLSPVQFVKSLRLNTAAMHLATGLGVNEAAYQVGYISPSQFSREFKRQFGTTPREWNPDAASV